MWRWKGISLFCYAMCKEVHNNYQKHFFSQKWSCNKEVITMGVFVYDCIHSFRYDICHSFLRSLMADIISSLMDKNHIQIHPWYNLYIYIYICIIPQRDISQWDCSICMICKGILCTDIRCDICYQTVQLVHLYVARWHYQKWLILNEI